MADLAGWGGGAPHADEDALMRALADIDSIAADWVAAVREARDGH